MIKQLHPLLYDKADVHALLYDKADAEKRVGCAHALVYQS